VTVRELHRAVLGLPPDRIFPRDRWGRDSRQHLAQFLAGGTRSRDARGVWGSLQNRFLLAWLAWGLGVITEGEARAIADEALAIGGTNRAAQARIVRARIPWERIAARLA
jgi:hypothetical protein